MNKVVCQFRFWEDLEEMKANSEESTALLRGASDTLREVYGAANSASIRLQ